MNRRFQFAVVATSTCVVILLLLGAVHGRSASTDSVYNHLGVYSEVLSRIKADYVEEPDMKAVTSGAINGLLESIDPYASYLSADQYKQYQKAQSVQKADVGIVLSRRYGYLSVEDAVPGGPAAKAGITTGDVVESINNVSTRDMPLAFSQMLLAGDNGTTVELSVLRVRKTEPQKFTLIRTSVAYPPVSAKLNTDQGDPVGVIQTYSLANGRVEEIASKIQDLQKQGAKRFVLDLRYCSAGDPEQGVALANLFMDKGMITYSQGQKVSREESDAVASKAITQAPLVVIVNRGTARGAEVAAAALLDSKRADVVGERTYGDAAIRKPVTMDDGSAVILSVAKYYAPDGKAIQDTGVTPNIAQADTDAQIDDIDDDSVPDTNSAPKGDPMMNKALDQIRMMKIITIEKQ
ncbi:MAG TPA: S41 family peptidase [Bryobacteraceae bacterium]|nr:S41 family peptidase [Bryobacteraceae bacterium]